MKPFTLTVHCTSNAHCGTCRNRIGGRAWREFIGTRFELPPGGVDFDCPAGKQWGHVVPPATIPAVPPDVVIERLRHCARCEDNVGGECRQTAEKYPGRANVAMGVRRKNSRCPRGLWGAIAT